MRTPRSAGAMRCVVLAALLSGMGAHAAEPKKPGAAQAVSAAADTQASARRQGAVNVGGIIWACSGTRCSASPMPWAVSAPAMVCQGLAREVGAIRSFAVANRPLNGDELKQCNSVVPATAAMPGMKPPAGFAPAPAPAPAPAMGFAAPSPLATDLKKNLPAAGKADRKASPYPENWTGPDLPAGKSPVFGAMKDELRKNEQAAMTPAKKPPGAKGTPQASAQGDGKASPSSSAAAPRPAGPFSPVAVRTPQLILTGIGVAEVIYRFTPVAVRTPQLTLTGIGVAEISYRFTPVAVRTPPLTLTGTGRSE